MITENGRQRLRRLEELGGRHGIAVGLVNRDVDKGLLEGLDDGAAGGDDRSRHDGRMVVSISRQTQCNLVEKR